MNIFLEEKDFVRVIEPTSVFFGMKGRITKIHLMCRPTHHEVTFPPQRDKKGVFVQEEYNTTFLALELEKIDESEYNTL